MLSVHGLVAARFAHGIVSVHRSVHFGTSIAFGLRFDGFLDGIVAGVDGRSVGRF